MLQNKSSAFTRLCAAGLLCSGSYGSATISDLAPPTRRATGLSVYSTIQGAGQAAGPVLAGMLIGRGRFDLAFLLAGMIALAGPVLVRASTFGSPNASARAIDCRQFTAGIIEVVAERRILVASIAHAFYFVINGTLNAFLPLFAADRIGLDAVQIGWLFGAQTVTTLAIRPAIGAASDRIGRRGAITAGLIGCAASVFAISLSTSQAQLHAAVLAYAVSVAITTAGAALTSPMSRRRPGSAPLTVCSAPSTMLATRRDRWSAACSCKSGATHRPSN